MFVVTEASATTPWHQPGQQGPAWANSLFEDNAGSARYRLAIESRPVRSPARARPSSGRPRDRARRAQSRNPIFSAARRCSAQAKSPRWTMPMARTWLRSPTSSCGVPCRSSASTVGPTISATAASTTCLPPGTTSTFSCSTPRCTPILAGRPRKRRRSAPRQSSRPREERCRARTSR